MKLSEMLKRPASKGRRPSAAGVTYSWQKNGKRAKCIESHAFVLTICGDTISKARYRKDDRAEIEVNDKDKTLSVILSGDGPFSINRVTKKPDATCLIKTASAGISTLEKWLPKMGERVILEISEISAGKIVVKI